MQSDRPPRPAASLSANGVWLLAVVMVGLAALPLLTVTHPPLQDYPNHLARAWLHLNADDPAFGDAYVIRWAMLPNLAFDLLAPALAIPFGIEAAGKLVIVLAFALQVTGTLALSRSLHGAPTVPALLASQFLFSLAFHKGFLGFLLGTGAALWALALFIRTESWSFWSRAALAALVSALLFFVHFTAVALFGLGAVLLSLRGPDRFRGMAVAILGVGPVTLGLMALSPNPGVESAITFLGWNWKIRLLSSGVPLLAPWTDLLLLGLLVGLIAFVRTRAGRIAHRRAWPLLFALALLYLILPYRLLTSENADWRLLLPFLLILCAALPDPFQNRHEAGVLVAICLVVLGVRTWGVADAWRPAEAHYRDQRQVLEALPRGARLYAVATGMTYEGAWFPVPTLHLGALAVIERAAVVPSLFAFAGQQPLRIDLPLSALDLPPHAETTVSIPWEQVRETMTHVLVHGTGSPPAEHFRLLAREGFAALYEVTSASGDGPTATDRDAPGSSPR